MTTDSGTVVEGEAVQDDEQQSIEQAEADFAAGFDNVAGTTETLGYAPEPFGTGGQDEDASAGTQEGAVGEVTELSAEEIRQLQNRQRRLEGQIGGYKSQFQRQQKRLEELEAKIAEQSGGATVQQQQELREGLKNIKALEASIEEFVELKPFMEELEVLAQRVADIQASTPANNGANVDVDEAVSRGIMNYAHPDWQETTMSPDFRKFVLSGGPSEEEYRDYAVSMQNPDADIPPEHYAQSWQQDYPGWWNDKGKLLFGDTMSSIGLLDRYAEAKEAQQQAQENRQRSSQQRFERLRKNIVPEGAGGDHNRGISPEQAFEAGFKRVTGGNHPR